MNTKQALDLGVIHARSWIDVIEAAHGPAVAAAAAKGMAPHSRDYLMRQSERDTCFWFTCLGQDAITQPEGA